MSNSSWPAVSHTIILTSSPPTLKYLFEGMYHLTILFSIYFFSMILIKHILVFLIFLEDYIGSGRKWYIWLITWFGYLIVIVSFFYGSTQICYLICFVISEHESPKSLKLKISSPFTISQEEAIEYLKAIVMRELVVTKPMGAFWYLDENHGFGSVQFLQKREMRISNLRCLSRKSTPMVFL